MPSLMSAVQGAAHHVCKPGYRLLKQASLTGCDGAVLGPCSKVEPWVEGEVVNSGNGREGVLRAIHIGVWVGTGLHHARMSIHFPGCVHLYPERISATTAQALAICLSAGQEGGTES